MASSRYPSEWPPRIRSLRLRLMSLSPDEWTQEALAKRIRRDKRLLVRCESAKIDEVAQATIVQLVEELSAGTSAEAAPPELRADAASLRDEVRRYQPAGPKDPRPTTDPRGAPAHRSNPGPRGLRRHLPWVLAALGLMAALVGFVVALRCTAPVVTGASLDDRPISPQLCSALTPCAWLRWESPFRFTMSPTGHAAVYLEAKGLYYLEGGMLVPFGDGGVAKLFPGVDGKADHDDFSLYVVTRRCRPLPRTRDDEGLSSLPSGRVWGPVHLLLAH